MPKFIIACFIALSAPVCVAAAVTLEYNTGAPYLTHIAALPGTQVGIPYYDEDGFRTKPFGEIRTDPPYGLSLVGPNGSNQASSGSAHLALLRDDSLEVAMLNGKPFAAHSVALAEYSTVFPEPKTIGFEGVFEDGSLVSTSFTTDGVVLGGDSLIDFETFTFPASFTGISKLRATTDGFSLDDLVLSPAPEPNSAFHAIIGAVIGACSSLRRVHHIQRRRVHHIQRRRSCRETWRWRAIPRQQFRR